MDINQDSMKPNKQRWCLWKKRIVGSKGSRLKNKAGGGGQEKEAFLSFFKRRLLLSFFLSFILSFFLPSFLPSPPLVFKFVFFDPYLFFLILICFFLIPICFFWSLTHSFLPSFLPRTFLPPENGKKFQKKNGKKFPKKIALHSKDDFLANVSWWVLLALSQSMPLKR